MTDIVHIAVEKITEKSFPDFISLIKELAEYEKLAPPDGDAILRLKEDAFSENPKYEAYLAFNGKIPVGYITFYFTYSTFLAKPTLYLEDIFVSKDYRKMGIGGMLFDFCRNVAKERGCGRMDWTVLTWNKPSIDFYENRGGKKQDWYLYRINGDSL
ncbi:GNAT family N-acetyltransferase [Methanoplanus endosymbiosus]|uniref:GNAT family N-acetyltransferase n=1 Tax=Methanoplanus endosymbiosus TaxID=33865 RepID=A0A9E7PJM6_9EURY|nr:GNAT family N-acetyltransferase [Methanoplanus endosymbiosus]UUX91148.1 GNAT family N-acetyltransferase [Methanoplanus endosymbiosus]